VSVLRLLKRLNIMSAFSKKQNQPPETVTGAEGTAKRNIIRRRGGSGSGGGPRKENLAGKSWDDGSIYSDPMALDEHDPNYDSEEETKNITIPTYSAFHREEIAKSKLTLTQYKKKVQPIIDEFFLSGEFQDTAARIEEVEAPEYSYEFVKRIVNAAIDKEDNHRELVSRLLSELYPDILSMNMIGKGFERLFEIADEIEIDAPQARSIIATFVARAVVDEVLPPSFLTDSVVCNLGGEIIEQAKLMLSRDHGGAKLERIWGPGDGRPVEELKVAIDQLLQEYLVSSDLAEAERCLRELHSPQFFHEVVKRAVTIAMDKTPEEQNQISALLAYLSSSQMLSHSQAQQGFNRLYGILPDLTLDVPQARSILDDFLTRAMKDGVVHPAYVPEATSPVVKGITV
jgi:programmed cell death protein 4